MQVIHPVLLAHWILRFSPDEKLLDDNRFDHSLLYYQQHHYLTVNSIISKIFQNSLEIFYQRLLEGKRDAFLWELEI